MAIGFSWRPLLSEGPLCIGILNLTPDSFSDGGRYASVEAALAHAHALVAAGARMLDLGAESTRPGAVPISPAQEWERLAAPLAAIRRSLPHVPLSLDTRHAATAHLGLKHGVAVINDVTGYSSPAMLDLARDPALGIIAMRSRRTGQEFLMPPYDGEGETTAGRTLTELQAVRDRLLDAAIAPERIMLDPGFGFGTTFLEDQALWEALPEYPHRLAWPMERICLGISRKRFTAWRANAPQTPPRERDPLAEPLYRRAFHLGVRAFRVHSIPSALRRGMLDPIF